MDQRSLNPKYAFRFPIGLETARKSDYLKKKEESHLSKIKNRKAQADDESINRLKWNW
jgi:hypothetical protein